MKQKAAIHHLNDILKFQRVPPSHLLENVPHLRMFSLEPLDLLMDPLVLFQLLHTGPLTVQV